jgi:FlaG/FlaF family flagellin (archaellin)
MASRIILIAIVFFLSSCANVKILDATAVQSSSENLTLKIRTNNKLEKYEDSFFAHHVYLKYITSNTEVKKLIESASSYWGFPFSVSNYEALSCEGEGVCYIWQIPMKDEANINAISYTYEIKSGDTITIKIGGGTMHGAQLKSGTKVVAIK